MTAYTRHTDEEVADRQWLYAYEQEQRDAADALLRDRHDIILARAKEDPAFKALAEHLGIGLEEL